MSPVLSALVAVFLWSTVATAFKLTLSYISPTLMLFYASLFSTIALGAVITFKKMWHLVFSCTKKELTLSAGAGFLNPFIYYLMLFTAYDMLNAQTALVLNYLWPVMLVALSSLFHRKPLKPSALLSLFICFAGVITVVTRGSLFSLDFSNPLGTLLAASTSIIWALFWILSAHDKRDQRIKLFLSFFYGTLFSGLFLIFTKSPSFPSLPALCGALYIGLFEMGFTFLLWLSALSRVKNPSIISNLVFLSPFGSLIFISLFLNEKITLSTITGLILVISGIILEKRYRD